MSTGDAAGKAVVIDGVLVAPDAAKVSVYDRGFLFGDAVFEVLRTYGGAPFAWDEHFARLRRSAERVLHRRSPSTAPRCGPRSSAAIAAAGNDESNVRIVLTRGAGPVTLDPGTAGAPLRVILVEPVVAAAARGVRGRHRAPSPCVTQRTVDGTAASGAKVTNYLESLLAVREAKARGAQEALIVDGPRRRRRGRDLERLRR